MVDLRPDTSFYPKSQQMGPGDIFGLIAKGRELQRQNAIDQATRDSTDKDTGNLDSSKFTDSLLKSGAILHPEDISGGVKASGDIVETHMKWMRMAGDALSSMITDPEILKNPELGPKKFAVTIGPMLVKAGLPANYVNQVGKAAPGQPFMDYLAQLHNWVHNNTGLETTTQVDEATGRPKLVPKGSTLYPGTGDQPTQQRGGGGTVTVTTPGGMTSTGTKEGPEPLGGTFTGTGGGGGKPGGPGSSYTDIGPQEKANRDKGEKAASALQDRAPDISNTRSTLTQLDAINKDTAAGSGARFQNNWDKLMNKLGLTELAGQTPEQVAKSEQFNKFVARMVGQMQDGQAGHSNAWLHNFESSNPGLEMSRLGRAGIIHWLQGLNDSENLMRARWSEWISRPENTGKQGQYLNWLNSKQGGNAGEFDPRVLQYERMTPEEQKEFRKDMSKDDLKTFRQHHEEYTRKGWIGVAQGRGGG